LAADPIVTERIHDLELFGPFALPQSTLAHACSGEACDPCLYDDLHSLWSVATAPLSRLKALLIDEAMASGVNDCPYCGLDPMEAFDHYLPQEAYPEFSVTAVNLIFVCGSCNLLKRAAVPHVGNRFLHPAFDPLDRRLLSCTIDDSSELPRAHFALDRTVLGGLGVLGECEFHFERLELGERLAKAAVPEIAAFLVECQLNGLSADASAASARVRSEAQARTWGPNRWTSLLYMALAEWLG